MNRLRAFVFGLAIAIAGGAAAVQSGGFPSRPFFQGIFVGNGATSGISCVGNTASACFTNNVTGHTAWAALVKPATGAGNQLGLFIQSNTGANSTDTLLRVDSAAGTTLSIKGDGSMTSLGVPLTAPIVCTTACNISTLQVGQSALITKTSNTSRASTTTFSLDPDLQFTNEPLGTYHVEGYLSIGGTASKVEYGSGSGCLAGTGASQVTAIFQTSTTIPVIAITANALTESVALGGAFVGTDIQSGSGSTTRGMCWTQAASNVTATTVQAGSFMKVTRLQ